MGYSVVNRNYPLSASYQQKIWEYVANRATVESVLRFMSRSRV